MRGKSGTEKRGFFSILRHPFRKPQPKPEPKLTADLRRPICFRGPCLVCPTGYARESADAEERLSRLCASLRRGRRLERRRLPGSRITFPMTATRERVAMERQAQRMHAAEAAQQSACSTGSRQECSDRTSASQSETSLYRTLQARYRACQQRSLGVNPFGHSASAGYSQGLSFYPLEFDLDYR